MPARQGARYNRTMAEWRAERVVDSELAVALISLQFPALSPVRLQAFGEGWDNTAYLVNRKWVFRFPRRLIAVGLIENEGRFLDALRLPLPSPRPEFFGTGSESYPWPFLGYRLLSGETADRMNLSRAQRRSIAPKLGEFLKALHSQKDAAFDELPVDVLQKLDVDSRFDKISEMLAQAKAANVIKDIEPYRLILERTPRLQAAPDEAVVHGDLYARHLLVDSHHELCGVIDWSDIHRGGIAVDLSIVYSFLPQDAHAVFFESYGAISDEQRYLAQFRSLYSALQLLVYGLAKQDHALVIESTIALGYLEENEP